MISLIAPSIIIRKSLPFLALFSLLGAYLYGYIIKDLNLQAKLTSLYSQDTVIQKVSTNPLIYSLSKQGHPPDGYLSVSTAQGWAGPLYVAVEINPSGFIGKINVLDHSETTAFYQKLLNNHFFKQFPGKKVSDPYIVGRDVVAVTRATVSSDGFTKAIRTGTYDAANTFFNYNLKDRTVRWIFGFREGILLLLYGLAILAAVKNISLLRYAALAGGLVFLGFYLNSSLSVSHLSALVLGYSPAIREYLFWWLLVAGILLIIIIYGKNLYCSSLCPFGALQEFLSKLSGFHIELHPVVVTWGRYIAYALTWLSLMVIFLNANPAQGTYEPFAAIFGFEGVGVMWYILHFILFSSFMIKRIWCRFFCPVGTLLREGTKARNRLADIMRKNLRKP